MLQYICDLVISSLFTVSVGTDANPADVEAAVVVLFTTFQDSPIVGHKHTTTLRSKFGPFPATSATKSCQIVNQILEWLPEDAIESLKPQKPESATGPASKPEFGHNIKFSAAMHDGIMEVDQASWLDSEADTDTSAKDFDMKYTQPSAAAEGKASEVKKSTSSDSLRASWLTDKLETALKDREGDMGMSVTDITNSVFDSLISGRSDEELQNEVPTSLICTGTYQANTPTIYL